MRVTQEWHNKRSLGGDERGFMLIELITALSLAVLLAGTFGYLIVVAGRHEPQISKRADQIQQGRVAVENMTREIREGFMVQGTPSSSQLSLNSYVRHASCGGTTSLSSTQPAIACRVSYSCSAGTCTRTEASTDGSGAGAPVVVASGLLDSTVFSYSPSATSPSHVTVTLTYPTDDDEESVTISDGAELRND